LKDIRDDWRPSGSIGGLGMFAVVWDGGGTTYWAALHDFDRSDRDKLLEMCRGLDRDACGGGGITAPGSH
jgi:hypothetical protein